MNSKVIDKEITVATHSGGFHADDVFAIAILKLIYKKVNIIRTRDSEILETVDLRVDIGRKYNPETGDFDHHQNDGPKERENGIPYASAGLIWKEYGFKLTNNKEVQKNIDDVLICPIDAHDVGLTIFETTTNIKPYTISNIINNFVPLKGSDSNKIYNAFLEAVEFAMGVLKREIENELKKSNDQQYILTQMNKREIKEILIIEDDTISIDRNQLVDTDVIYTIYPIEEGWSVKAVSKFKDSFENKKDLPKAWAGLEEDLEKETGVKGAYFCHKNLFIAVTKTLEGAKKLAMIALENNESKK